jgi:hypothetical protein
VAVVGKVGNRLLGGIILAVGVNVFSAGGDNFVKLTVPKGCISFSWHTHGNFGLKWAFCA